MQLRPLISKKPEFVTSLTPPMKNKCDKDCGIVALID